MGASGNSDWPLHSRRANTALAHRKSVDFSGAMIDHTVALDLFFGSAVVTRTGTLAGTTDDVTLAGDGTVWIKGPLAFTTDDVTLAAAGTVSAGGGTRTGALAFTTDAVSLGAESQNIPPPGAFTVALDYRRPSVLQPIVHMPRVAGVPGGPRMRAAGWRR